MAKNDNSRGDPALAAHYVDRFVEYLEACARHRFGCDPDPFLLQARRALEAAVYAVWSAKFGVPPAKPLQDLLTELVSKGMIHPVPRCDFDGIRARTNRAAHVPRPEDAHGAEVEPVARDLPAIAVWVAKHGLCTGAELASRVDRALSHIRGEPRLIAPDLELDQLREDANRARDGEAGARAEAHDLRRRLDDVLRDGGVRLESGRAAPPPYAVGVLIAIVAVAGGGGVGWLVSGATTEGFLSARPVAHAVVASTPEPAGAISGAEPDAGVVGAEIVDAVIDASQRTDHICPDGMVRIEGGELRLAPPHDRSQWVPASLPPATHHVPPFCLAARLVTSGELGECVREGRCEAQARCRAPSDASAPASCVSADAAAAYCRWRLGEGAGLPSVAQLEHVARREQATGLLPRAAESRDEQRFEWSADPYPSPAFSDRARPRPGTAQASMGLLARPAEEPRPRISWNRAESLAGTAQHRFRCIAPLMAVRPDDAR